MKNGKFCKSIAYEKEALLTSIQIISRNILHGLSLLTVIGDRDDDHLHPKYLNRAANLRVEARHNPETKKIAKRQILK